MHISQSLGGITFLSSFLWDLWHIRTDSVTVMSVHTCIVIYRWWELTGWAKMTFAADELHCSELRNAAVSFLSCLSAFSVSSPLTLREGFGPACQELALVAWPQWHLLNKSVTHELTLCKMIEAACLDDLWHHLTQLGTRRSQSPPGSGKICLLSLRGGWLVGRWPPSLHSYLIIWSCRDPSWLTCCLRDVAEPWFAALSGAPLSSTGPGTSALAAAGPRSSRAASTISMCLHLSTSSSSTPASVALRRSPMRTRSVPDQSEFTQLRRPAILVASGPTDTLQVPCNG